MLTQPITIKRNERDSRAFGSPVWDVYQSGHLIATTTGQRNEREVRAYILADLKAKAIESKEVAF